MLLSALDPALLVYRYEHWLSREPHCFRRFEALTLHRREIRKYDLKFVMCYRFAALIQQFFPWNGNCRSIGELRDLRQFMLIELQKAHYVEPKTAQGASLRPEGVLCDYIEDPEVIETWNELLCGCVDQAVLAEFDPQIATWETLSLCQHSSPMTLSIQESETAGYARQFSLPLVWDDDSWAARLATQDWWPDLQRCVEVHFRANAAIRNHSEIRETPFPFECSPAFMRSLERFCREKGLRRSLVQAVTKLVYGIRDLGLGFEPFGDVYRFRVTDYWRVHCRKLEDRFVLEEFGPHDIGGAD